MTHKGFSLVELMVVLVISMIALGILGRAFVTQKQSYDEQSAVVEMQQNAKISMYLMSAELQMAGAIAEGRGKLPTTDVSGKGFSDAAADDIEEMAVNAVTFLGDIDNDAKTETVRYAWSGTDGDPLTREVWKWDGAAWGPSSGEQIVADIVQSLVFSYYNENGTVIALPSTATADRADVRKINVVLIVKSETLGGKTRTQRMSSDIAVRNLGLLNKNTNLL